MSRKKPPSVAALRTFVRAHGGEFLDDPNVTSVGVGYKVVDGVRTDTVCVQFSVARKAEPNELQSLGTKLLPETVTIGGDQVPTDVVERRFRAGGRVADQTGEPLRFVVAEAEDPERTRRRDPVLPGISVANVHVSAGTFGAVVYDSADATPYVLSNWHVLHGPEGSIGDDVVQPGPHDDANVEANRLGKLIRSHLSVAGDGAVATLDQRRFATEVFELGVTPSETRRAELDDKVVKSGRTTGVTHGVVTRVETIAEIDYGGDVGVQRIGGFEIGVDPDRRPAGGEISMGGDSGSLWLFRSPSGQTTKVAAGLHFAGESGAADVEHALACDADAIMGKLGVTLVRADAEEGRAQAATGTGYDPDFLGTEVPVPRLEASAATDAVKVGRSAVVPYTHFSLTMSRARRFAHWVAWNVDGASIRKLDRSRMRFRLDPRVPDDAQVGDELYGSNDLDRGHLARRSDLTWGPQAEADAANADSFFFTNIAPQMKGFNQSRVNGIWGRLEDALYEQVGVDDLRVSVFAGPAFRDDDRDYRGVKVPREFWKAIAYVEDGTLKTRAFLLAQSLDRLEELDLDAFSTYQVTLGDVEARTSVVFGRALRRGEPKAIREEIAAPTVLESVDDIRW